MKNIKTFLATAAVIFITITQCQAECSAANVGYSVDNLIVEYLSSPDGKNEVVSEITNVVNEAAGLSVYTSAANGEIQIGEPFIMPLYNAPTHKAMVLSFDKNNIRYSAIYQNEKLIGLLRYTYLTEKNDFELYYMILPNDFLADNNAVVLYDWRLDKNNQYLYGNSDCNILFSISETSSELVYAGKSNFVSTDYSNNLKAVIAADYPVFNYKWIKKYSGYDKYSRIICSFEIIECVQNEINDNSFYIIQNAENGMVLTYNKGKYTLTRLSEQASDNQKFIVNKSKNGYTISPYANTNKKMSVGKNANFGLRFSYCGQMICTISCTNTPDISLKSNGDKFTASSYKLDMSFDWIIIQA